MIKKSPNEKQMMKNKSGDGEAAGAGGCGGGPRALPLSGSEAGSYLRLIDFCTLGRRWSGGWSRRLRRWSTSSKPSASAAALRPRYTIHHTPYTIHQSPDTIHHTPSMHHTPYTIHHTPRRGRGSASVCESVRESERVCARE